MLVLDVYEKNLNRTNANPTIWLPPSLLSLSEASLVIGDPSVIPCGVSEDSLDKGVVQIPLQFTVGKTVEFIRSVSSSDRYSSKVLHAMTEKTTGAEREGGIGVAEAPWPSSAFSSPSLLDRGNYK